MYDLLFNNYFIMFMYGYFLGEEVWEFIIYY